MRSREYIIEQIIDHLKASIRELEETLQSEKASLYGETKSSAGDKYETQREMIQGEIQRTKTQWSLKNEQLESLYSLLAWEQNALEKLAQSSNSTEKTIHPFQHIRNGSIVQLISTLKSYEQKDVQSMAHSSGHQKSHPPKENDETYMNSDGMWLFIGVSLGDIRINISTINSLDSNNLNSTRDIQQLNNAKNQIQLKTLTIESPLGKILLGKQSGDSFILNGKSFSIFNCF